jgi:hypothetical protein
MKFVATHKALPDYMSETSEHNIRGIIYCYLKIKLFLSRQKVKNINQFS